MRGSFVHNPDRKKDREYEPVNLPPLGECPPDMDAETVAAWQEIVTTAPAGVLKAPDRIAVKIAARLLAAMNAGRLDDKGRAQLITLLGKFGMTPSDRSKVRVFQDSSIDDKANKYLG